MLRYKCPKCGKYWEDANPPIFPDMPSGERAEKVCKDCIMRKKIDISEIKEISTPVEKSLESSRETTMKAETPVMEPLENDIARAINICDNILTNVKDETLRERIHKLSQNLMVAFSFIISDKVKLYEELRLIVSELDSFSRIIDKKVATELRERYRLWFELAKGPVKLGESDLNPDSGNIDLLIRFLKHDVAELYVVPKGWVIDRPLWFKDYYVVEESDFMKLKYGLEEIRDLIKNVPETLRSSLNKIIEDMEREMEKD